MPTVHFTANLKRFYPDLVPFEVEAHTVAELIHAVEAKHLGLRDYLVDDQGQLRKHVNVFVGNTLIADRIGLSDALTAQDEVYIMQALSGG
ncbi:MAG TPA: molybdenum cofactor biosynthesis protein MoaD [Cytophagales bacterium]|nr:molybdenum cofactor biosynthesis protein MoaD [Cytophagales bacterium]HAP60066.1 molybdenum cofactor biosynthesis protein MoaD [Cytophagales bacterium]